jgi:hypothetical protein
MKTPISLFTSWLGVTASLLVLTGMVGAQTATTGTATAGTTTAGTATAGTATAGTATGGTTGTNETNTGVFVYELSFKHREGFNVDFWGGGFVVVPAIGGTGSVILTAIDNGKKEYVLGSNSVDFYFAKTREKRFSVVAMGSGAPGGEAPVFAMQAFGESNYGITIQNQISTLKVKAAKLMKGYAQASQDEGLLTAPSSDGTVSFVEFSEMKLEFDDKLTDRMNERFGGAVGTAFTELEAEVKRRGYVLRATGTTGTATAGTTTAGTATAGTATAGTTTGTTTGATTDDPDGDGLGN